MPVVACTCGKKFRAIDALAGKQVNCPGCGRPLLIPQASLLDEELARPVVPRPADALSPRARLQQRSATMDGWVIALLVLAGGVAAVAVLAAVISLLIPGADRQIATEGPNTPDMPAPTPPPLGEAPTPSESSQAELETAAPTADTGEALAAPASDTAPIEPKPAQPSLPPPVVENREPPPQQQPPRPSSNASPSAANPIRLSLGVALAQTLPTGTAMGFSVEYEFVGPPPTGPTTFYWVIEPGKGQTVRQPVQLNARGTLQGFVPQLRPEHAPFNTHIEDQSGNRLSKSLALR